jgi:alanine or glycine:cation symporter, AGCS family
MAIKFSEAALGVKYRIARGEQTLAGPMYYLRDGLKSPAVAWVFALLAGIACLFTTPFTQPNSIAVAVDSQLKNHSLDVQKLLPASLASALGSIDANRLLIGLVLAVLTWLVIIGGVKSIGRAAEKLSPLKVALYLVGGLIVIVTHLPALPGVLSLVFREAFSMQAGLGTAQGASVWLALRYGLARAAYANEAGFGTAAVVYGVAKSNRPDQQGLNAVMEVFIITYVTSTISAMTILLTGAWNIGNQRAAVVVSAMAVPPAGNAGGIVAEMSAMGMLAKMAQESAPQSSAAVAEAFNATMPTVGGWMLAVSVLLFGYTALMGWAFYGEQYLEYLFGPRIVMPYRWIYCCLIPLGAIAKVDLVWAWGDILNGSQIFPNLIGLFALSGAAAAYARKRSLSSAAT